MSVQPLIDVVDVVPLSDHTLVILFEDDSLKHFNVVPYLKVGGVFEALRAPVRFAAAYVDIGTVCWPGNIDLAPELLYEEGSVIASLEGTTLTEAEGARILRMLLRSPSKKGLEALILYFESRQSPDASADNPDRQTLDELRQVHQDALAKKGEVATAWTKFEAQHGSFFELNAQEILRFPHDDSWVQESVVPVLKAGKANPLSAVSTEDVREMLETEHNIAEALQWKARLG